MKIVQNKREKIRDSGFRDMNSQTIFYNIAIASRIAERIQFGMSTIRLEINDKFLRELGWPTNDPR